MVGTARAVATALHERPNLFDKQAAYLQKVRRGKDLYAHPIINPIQLDGHLNDWAEYQHLAIAYDQRNIIRQSHPSSEQSLSFKHLVGRYRQYLYAMFDVADDHVVLRNPNVLRVDKNDHILISLKTPEYGFQRFIISPHEEGWVNAYLLQESDNSGYAKHVFPSIQGFWRLTEKGYQVELRLPLNMLMSEIAFAVTDVDNQETRQWVSVMGTGDPDNRDDLGTVLVPSPEIEKIIRGLRYANSRVWVIDNHNRVLARSGSIHSSVGLKTSIENEHHDSKLNGIWSEIENSLLLPLYYKILTRPPSDFVDELENAYSLKGKAVLEALTGEPASHWYITPDNKAVILSAAHPIFIEDKVMGAVVVEQTTHGIRTLRNRALEQLFHVILGMLLLSTTALFFFASRISMRVTKLRNETEAIIDKNGRIIGNIVPASARDEIGDLSRAFYDVINRLNNYNNYLENMSSRLSHELRTPIAIVNSSLENLALNHLDTELDEESREYIHRAQQGIRRLSKILSSMSEATRMEHALQSTQTETFAPLDVVRGCTESYAMTYSQRKFNLEHDKTLPSLQGSPELFAQMLDKIIANAVEFSPIDSTIGIAMHQLDGKLVLRITNTGPVLPDNMQSQLANSMISVRKSEHSQDPHLGLGLYIARIIAEFHNGKLSIQNLPDGSGVEVLILLTYD